MLLGEGTWGDHHVYWGRVSEGWLERGGEGMRMLLKVNIEGERNSEHRKESESKKRISFVLP